MKLKIVAISDMHGKLPVIKEPADIMLIAGDIVPLEIQFNKEFSKQNQLIDEKNNNDDSKKK